MQPLADQLKEITSDAHAYAETRPLQRTLVRGDIPDEMLGTFLAQLLHVHEAMERGIEAHEDVARALDWQPRFRHSARLRADLRDRGIEPATLPPNGAARALIDSMERATTDTPCAIGGAFYVLEGSMNGNRFIVRALAGREGARGLSYFDPYGEEQRSLWVATRARLDDLASSEAERAAIIAMAERTFDGIAAMSDEVYADSTTKDAGVACALEEEKR